MLGSLVSCVCVCAARNRIFTWNKLKCMRPINIRYGWKMGSFPTKVLSGVCVIGVDVCVRVCWSSGGVKSCADFLPLLLLNKNDKSGLRHDSVVWSIDGAACQWFVHEMNWSWCIRVLMDSSIHSSHSGILVILRRFMCDFRLLLQVLKTSFTSSYCVYCLWEFSVSLVRTSFKSLNQKSW